MFGHHAWATEQLLDFCAGLPPERLDLCAEGTYGAVLPTLIHLLAADQRFLLMLGAGEAQPGVREDRPAELRDLQAAWQDQVPRWQRLLPRADELEITIPSRRGRDPVPHAAGLLFTQAIHHGNDHRTQVCSTLSIAGVAPPTIDVWSYWAATHR
jgi:uncharacterized damage-inducible protein DinB